MRRHTAGSAASPQNAGRVHLQLLLQAGALWAYYPVEVVQVVREETGGVYSARSFNHHHFCARCGCGTYGISPEWSRETMRPTGRQRIQINARRFDDFDLSATPVELIDGRSLW
jgi:hypothetical protein